MREMEPVIFHPSGSPAPEFVPDPAHGRVFAVARYVRSSEVTPGGRLRFDALARYLQDAAEDDLADAGWHEPHDWLVRRVSVAIGGYPAHGDPLSLRTFCSATGPRWAARTTTVPRSGPDLMQAVALQDAAEDDLADAGWHEPHDWLVRRVSVAIGGYPAHQPV